MKISKYRNGYRTQVRTPDGKYKGVYGKTKKEVRQKANSLITEIETGNWIEKNEYTVEGWCNNWLENYTEYIKPATRKSYVSIISQYIIPTFKKKRLQDLTTLDVQKFINNLAKTKSAKTVANTHSCLMKVLRDAQNNQLINHNPAEHIKKPKVVRKEMNTLPEDKIVEFLEESYKVSEYANMIEFDLRTGLRMSELVALTFDRYNEINKTITIDRQLTMGRDKYFVLPKHDVIRTVPIDSKCIEIIEKQKGSVNYSPDSFIFQTRKGTSVPQTTLSKHFKKIVANIGLPDLRFHDLRHTYATMNMARGLDVKTLSHVLGHATVEFSLNRYIHVNPVIERQGVEKLGRFYDELIENSAGSKI